MDDDAAKSRFAPLAAIVLVVLIGTAACWAWAHASPAPGQRPFSPTRIWTARSGAIGLWALAQTILFWMTLPGLYRRRTVYLGLASVCGLVALLAGATAGGLALANA